MNDFYMQLLSAGVVVAIVEGFFSILLARRNNKLLLEQQKNEHNFEIQKTQYEQLTKAYENLMQELPEEKKLSHVITNSTIGSLGMERSEIESQLGNIGAVAAEEEMVLYNHYQKYSYLLNDSQVEELQKIIAEHDEKAQDQDPMWLLTIVQFEESYTNAIREKLSELSKTHN